MYALSLILSPSNSAPYLLIEPYPRVEHCFSVFLEFNFQGSASLSCIVLSILFYCDCNYYWKDNSSQN